MMCRDLYKNINDGEIFVAVNGAPSFNRLNEKFLHIPSSNYFWRFLFCFAFVCSVTGGNGDWQNKKNQVKSKF